MTFGKVFLVGGRAAPAIVGRMRQVGWVRQVGQKNRGNRPLYRKKILTLYFIITN